MASSAEAGGAAAGAVALVVDGCPPAVKAFAGLSVSALVLAYGCVYKLRAGYFSQVSDLAYSVGLLAALVAAAVGRLYSSCWSGGHWWAPAAFIAGVASLVYLLQRCHILHIGRWPESWPYVVGTVRGAELELLRADFCRQCDLYREKLDDDFDLELLQAYRVKNPKLEADLDAYADDLIRVRRKEGNRRLLYHGTSKGKAMSIICHGFRIPYLGGWFGRGIYFADCPLKAAMYSRASGCMLLCEVELGLSKEQFKMQDIIPESHLRQFRKLLSLRELIGLRSFDSVRASDDPLLGCVDAPEFVVYHSEQAVPRFVFIFRRVPRPSFAQAVA